MKVGNPQRAMSLFSFLSSHVILMVHTFKWHLSSSFLWCDICKISPYLSSVYGCDFERNI